MLDEISRFRSCYKYKRKGVIDLRYEGVVYRPPSEANSLIIQLTIGCARNTCTFCSMYMNKKFRVRSLEEVQEDLQMARTYYRDTKVKRIFLADGDALIVPTKRLLKILEMIRTLFPEVERISTYGAPRDILVKLQKELEELKAAGLDLIYMGIESGADEILSDIQKGVNAAEMIQAGQSVKAAGIRLSVTLISGLGGKENTVLHATKSAEVVSAICPDYVGVLTLMVEPETPMAQKISAKQMIQLSPQEILDELAIFIKNLDSKGTIFRSNHASNYVSFGGTLNQDREKILMQIQQAREQEMYKPEYFRGL